MNKTIREQNRPTITIDGTLYELVPYSTEEQDSEGYYYTKFHGYLLKESGDE